MYMPTYYIPMSADASWDRPPCEREIGGNRRHAVTSTEKKVTKHPQSVAEVQDNGSPCTACFGAHYLTRCYTTSFPITEQHHSTPLRTTQIVCMA